MEEEFEFKQQVVEEAPKPKKRGRKKKSTKVNTQMKTIEKEELKERLAEEDKSLTKLKDQFKKMVLANPNYDLTAPFTMNQNIALIDNMEKEEIMARMEDFRRNYARKIDTRISETALDVTAVVLGKVLKCQQELQAEFSQDQLLKESVSNVLGAEVLTFLDPKLKITGLMAVDIGRAYIKSLPRQKVEAEALQKRLEAEQNQLPPPEPETAKAEPEPVPEN